MDRRLVYLYKTNAMSLTLLKTGIITAGIISLLVANGHRQFYQYFHWEEAFQNISLLNAKVFYTIHLFLIPLFLFSAAVSFLYTDELVAAQGLARGVLIFHVLFWLSRALWQIYYFHPAKMGQDKGRTHRVHYIVLTAATSCCLLYAAPLLKLIANNRANH
jgi:hypothetical protein